jgi:hypothetical protein
VFEETEAREVELRVEKKERSSISMVMRRRISLGMSSNEAFVQERTGAKKEEKERDSSGSCVGKASVVSKAQRYGRPTKTF